GFGINQPGGWTYSVLAFVEERAIRDAGKGLTGTVKQQALARMQSIPAPTFNCPSRRGSTVAPLGDPGLVNVDTGLMASLGGSRSDYAGNGGTDQTGYDAGNDGPAAGSDQNASYDIKGYFRALQAYQVATGTIYCGSMVRVKDIPDGLSKTYLIGEKALAPQYYNPAEQTPANRNLGDDQSMYQGFDYDTIRWAGNSLTPPATLDALPLKDENHFTSGGAPDGKWGITNFGSAHSSGCFFAMCDGSVQTINYTVDPKVHWKLANRKDGSQVNLP
ncbi:MAG TPA: DUF1559 domain-containing protein, partial [Pirellulales bacterium]